MFDFTAQGGSISCSQMMEDFELKVLSERASLLRPGGWLRGRGRAIGGSPGPSETTGGWVRALPAFL